MFISTLDLLKVGIGPSSSHTMGPMFAALQFRRLLSDKLPERRKLNGLHLHCVLKGSLAFTGKGHATDRAILMGLHGYAPVDVATLCVDTLVKDLGNRESLQLGNLPPIRFSPTADILFDKSETLPQHPNGMILKVVDDTGKVVITETYFSIGGGFIKTIAEIDNLIAPIMMSPADECPYPFDSAVSMLEMAEQSGLTIAAMKRANERFRLSPGELSKGLDTLWSAMQTCIRNGLKAEGILPGGLFISRRAPNLHRQLLADPENASVNDWLCAYAMAVNEENAAGHMVVTAPTNGAAGVIPAVLEYFVAHLGASREQVHDFLLTAAAIGGLIKHKSSISGAEVGCQGEVGSAASMAAAGLCAARGGTIQQVENAAEIALEHHLGMTCDPVAGLVQVPCIERNGFGAFKAFAAASLALRESGNHFMPLDSCISAMKQTGMEMSQKFKETSLGGLAVSYTEC